VYAFTSKGLDFESRQIAVRDAKGAHDCFTYRSAKLVNPLQDYLIKSFYDPANINYTCSKSSRILYWMMSQIMLSLMLNVIQIQAGIT
jgi:hypothetical protein